MLRARVHARRSGGASGPAPGEYSLPTMASDLMKRVEGSRGVGVFGCTTKRFFKGIVSAGDGDIVPGPGEYLQTVRWG